MRTCNSFSKLILALLVSVIFPSVSYSQGNDNTTGVSGEFSGSIITGGSYDPYTGNAKRVINDLTVPGSLGAYPLKWNRTLNTRTSGAMSGHLGVGGHWRHSYQWSLSVYAPHPPPIPGEEEPREPPDAVVRYPDGRSVEFYGDIGVGQYLSGIAEEPGGMYHRLSHVGNDNYDLKLPDGGKVRFIRTAVIDSTGQTVYWKLAKEIVDPHGLVTTLDYDSYGKLTKVTEPGGRYLQITYTVFPVGSQYTLIGSVQAFDGRGILPMETVTYNYTAVVVTPYTFPYLTQAAYDDGTAATYTYQPSNMTGTNAIKAGLVSTCDDVRYAGAMRKIKYEYMPDSGSGTVGWGQIKREKNATTNQVVSEVTYPTSDINRPYNDPAGYVRTETRGDGKTRSFQYYYYADFGQPGTLLTCTDFKGQTTSFSYDYNVEPGSFFRKTVTDARGKRTEFYHESWFSALKKIVHHDGSFVQFEHTDPNSPYYVSARTDERGNTTSYLRDANNRVSRINYPDGTYETFTFNSFGQVLTHRLRNNDLGAIGSPVSYEHFEYDARGLLRKKWNPTTSATPVEAEPKTTYTYYGDTSGDPVGWTDRVKTETDPRGNVVQVEYDRHITTGQPCAGRGLLTKKTFISDNNNYQSFGYDIYGNKVWEENELRQRTEYTYDGYRRLLTTKLPGQTAVSSNDYRLGGTVAPELHTTSAVWKQTSAAGIEVQHAYDENFRRISTTEAAVAPDTAAVTQFEYDAVGNRTAVIDPRGKRTSTTYDDRNRKKTVTNALNQVTTWNYDPASNMTSIIRPDTTTETKTYDALNRMLTHAVPESATSSLTTTLTYHPSGPLASATDAKGQTTTFEYDAAGLKTKMTYPNLIDFQTWTYDEAKNMTARRAVNGMIQSFAYDSRNRKTGMSWSNAADSATLTYDAAGRMLTAVNPHSTITRAYDAAGRLILDRQSLGALGNKDVQYEYDADGKQMRLYVSSAGYDRTYGYDARGRFEKIFTTGQSNPAFEYDYDKASNETKRFNHANSVEQLYTRDDINRMSRLDLTRTGNTIGYEVYGYDSMNRMNAIDREDLKRDGFSYDQSGQLTAANYGLVGGINPNRAVGYVWDKAGNRSTVTENAVPTAYTTNNLNQYLTVGAQPVVNGPEHAIASYEGAIFTHINDERLSGITKGTDSYQLGHDGLGRCVKRTLNGTITYYLYDGEKPIVEYNATGGIVATNVYGKAIDEILQRVDATFGTYYYQQDHEGSVTHLTNSAGQIIEKYRYDAFGAPTIFNSTSQPINSSAFGNRFLFTGREYAAKFGIYEYRARAYHPGLGRFMSEDPIGFAAGDYNLYRYCGNDPIDRVDPDGLADRTTGGPLLAWGPWQWAMAEMRGFSFAELGADVRAANAASSDQTDSGDSMGSKSVSFSMKADIRRPDPQSGLKMQQTVTVREDGTWTETHSTGSTKVGPGVDVPAARIYSANVTPVKGNPHAFDVTMRGASVSVPLMGPAGAVAGPAAPALFSIHYSLRGTVDFGKRSASLGGVHSSYPSFSGQISGRTVFDRFQGRPPLIGLLPGMEVRSYGEIHF